MIAIGQPRDLANSRMNARRKWETERPFRLPATGSASRPGNFDGEAAVVVTDMARIVDA